MRYFIVILTLLLLPFLVTSCSSLLYFPDHVLYSDPEKMGIKYDEIHFSSVDGTPLFAWFFHSSVKTKGTIVQFHGNAENLSSHSLALSWLTREGYNLLSFDYRGYGKSKGEPSTKGCTEDGLAALGMAWELNQKNGGGKFIVQGQSIGGAIALRSLEEFKNKNQIDLLVLESTFVSYRRVGFRVAKRHWQTVLASPFVWLFMSDRYAGEDTLKENKAPVLVIHDQEDPTVPFANGEDIYEKVTAPKLFWKPNYGEHIGAFGHVDLRTDYVNLLNKLGTKESLF